MTGDMSPMALTSAPWLRVEDLRIDAVAPGMLPGDRYVTIDADQVEGHLSDAGTFEPRWRGGEDCPLDLDAQSHWVLLGVDTSGCRVFGVRFPRDRSRGLEPTVALRAALVAASPIVQDWLVTGAAVLTWQERHRFCGTCGQRNEVRKGGWEGHCPQCGAVSYPRTDPAVMMVITDRADRILLARSAGWSSDRMSLVAGFVEPGETLENAARREAWEEVGVRISTPRYVSSQPWPFPCTLMTGFEAVADDDHITVDGVEIVAARWFSREELRQARLTGELRQPAPLSISDWLIRRWLND